MAGDTVHLYFHSPCFDGTISAVLLSDYFENARGSQVALHPVNYHLNETWEAFAFEQPAAIVDFQYHPKAVVWFDHHATAFLTPGLEAHYRSRHDPLVIYDPSSPSCAMLIWKQRLTTRAGHFEKVQAADRIDSASYDSPHEAVFGDTPALRINASLAVGETDEYSCFLVRQLMTKSLADTAELPAVKARYTEFVRRRDEGMRKFRRSDNLRSDDGFTITDDGLVVFVVDESEGAISRYAPFTVAPTAKYSLGVTHTGDRAKISAMRNPWQHFESIPLGQIFKKFGGGGHQRVASTRLHGKNRDQIVDTLLDVKRAIEFAIEEQSRKAPA